MAGKFLTIEEAARLLGVSIDEVNTLVDRKRLFPMRDGATVKFKTDEVERLVRTLGEEAAESVGDLDIDLDEPRLELDDSPGRGDDEPLVLDDGADSIFAPTAEKGPSSSDTGVGTGGGASGSGLQLAGADDDLVLGEELLGEEIESDDLSIESIVGSSSPSLGGPADAAGSGPLAIELSGIGGDAGSGKSGGKSGIGGLSGPGLSGPGLSGPGLSGPGLGGLSGGLGSGVSLGDSGLADSGVDLGSAASAAKAAASADDFELGGMASEEESASVVIASDSEAGDSSFFGNTIGAQSSSFATEDSSLGSAGSSEGLVFPTAALEEVNFSVWQIVGLVCCSLLLLFGGFIAYDLVRTIGSPENTALSNPLLEGLASVFGWR